MSRRNARILAFQALYSWDVSGSSLEDLLTFEWTKKDAAVQTEEDGALIPETKSDEKTFASLIISGTFEHMDEINKMIESHLSATWTMERINKVTLAILRTSIYEMLFLAGTQKGIVIDEAVNISKNYGTDDSYKFINAVLDKIGNNEKNPEA